MRGICVCGQPTACWGCNNRRVKDGESCHATCPKYMEEYNYNVNVVYPRRVAAVEMANYTVEQKIKSARKGGKRV